MDGVLADSEPLHGEAWRLTVEDSYGKALPLDLMATAIGTPDRIFAEKLRKKAGIPATLQEFLGEKRRRFFSSLEDGRLQAKPGAVRLVADFAKKGLPLAVASGSGRMEVGTTLRILGLLPHMRFFLAHEDVAAHKPHPQVYLQAARRLGLAASACLVIEDSPVGLRAAWEAGCFCVGVAGSYPKAALRPAHLVLNSLEEGHRLIRLLG